jgi:hypothetical protein
MEGKQSMNYLQYAFYAINIYLGKVMEDFRWGNTCARQSGNLAARAPIYCVGDTGSTKGCNNVDNGYIMAIRALISRTGKVN